MSNNFVQFISLCCTSKTSKNGYPWIPRWHYFVCSFSNNFSKTFFEIKWISRLAINCLPREHNIADPLLRRRGLSCRRWAVYHVDAGLNSVKVTQWKIFALYIYHCCFYISQYCLYIHDLAWYIYTQFFIYICNSFLYKAAYFYILEFILYICGCFYIYNEFFLYRLFFLYILCGTNRLPYVENTMHIHTR